MTSEAITDAQILAAAQRAIAAHIQRTPTRVEAYACGNVDVLCSAIEDVWSVMIVQKSRVVGEPRVILHLIHVPDELNTHTLDMEYAQDIMTALGHVTNGEWS